MKKRGSALAFFLVLLLLSLSGCGTSEGEVIFPQKTEDETTVTTDSKSGGIYTANTKIEEVINDPAFGDYGHLIFPADTGYFSGDTLGGLQLAWYNNIDPDKTVEIVNYFRDKAASGEPVFYNIYTDEEKTADPAKEDTGLFFSKGIQGNALRYAMQEALLLM